MVPIPHDISLILAEFADVIPPTLPLVLPPSLERDSTIDLELGVKPPAHRKYRMSPAEEKELKSQLDAYLKAGQIEHAKSHFGAGVLFARKKDGNLHL